MEACGRNAALSVTTELRAMSTKELVVRERTEFVDGRRIRRFNLEGLIQTLKAIADQRGATGSRAPKNGAYDSNEAGALGAPASEMDMKVEPSK